MKKSSVILLTGMFCLISLLFFGGCTKKTVLKEEAVPKESQMVGKETPKVAEQGIKEEEKRLATEEQAVRKAALSKQVERDAAAKAKAETEEAKRQAAATVSSKDVYEITDIHFGFDKFNLGDEARDILNNHAKWLSKNKDVLIVIEGHCDERGSAEYNLALGERRANSTAKYLTNMGIDEKRIKTISYGFEKPLDPSSNEAAWAKNRRANFVSGKQ
jgi:peptidoglycan-associated lipoprotein